MASVFVGFLEACELLGISQSTLRRWIELRIIKLYQPEGKYHKKLFAREEIDRLVRAAVSGAPAEEVPHAQG